MKRNNITSQTQSNPESDTDSNEIQFQSLNNIQSDLNRDPDREQADLAPAPSSADT